MATVMGGVSFGLYVTAKRYLLPLIKPPTPEQLTQDKTAIDESFNKAFSTLETLEADTKALKEAEETRTTRLDNAITELEAALSSLKEADRKRDTNVRRNADELRSLRDLIPKAIDAHKQATEQRVKELATEVKSLKTLISNRMGTGTPVTQPVAAPGYHKPNGSIGGATSPVVAPEPAVKDMATSPLPTPTVETSTNEIPKQATAPSSTPTSSFLGSGGYASRFGTGRATIPEWQRAAAKKSQESLNASAGVLPSAPTSAPQTPTVTDDVSPAGA
jgi:peroxin-14